MPTNDKLERRVEVTAGLRVVLDDQEVCGVTVERFEAGEVATPRRPPSVARAWIRDRARAGGQAPEESF